MKKRTLLSWSSGKDSAWALHLLRQDPAVELVGLFTTVNQVYERVAMHAVRVELLKRQAECVGLPIEIIEIPSPCSNEAYAACMQRFVEQAKADGIKCFAFGDLYLEDIRQYRVDNLDGTGITPLFPLWQIPTDELSQTMIASGLKAHLTCVDPKQLSAEFAGRLYDDSLLKELPHGVDRCGENGEFHSFVFDGPMFEKPVEIKLGEVIERDGFVFADLLPSS